MKRIALIITLLLAIVGGIYYFQPPPLPPNSATLLSEKTVFYLELPELVRTGHRWDMSAMAPLVKDEGVRPFLRRPMQALLTDPRFLEVREFLTALKFHQLFVSANISTEGNPELLIGMRAKGHPEAISQALARLHQKIASQSKNAAPLTSSTLEGLACQSQKWEKGEIFTATGGGWVLLSNSAVSLEDFALRLAGKAPSPSLNEKASFAEACRRLGSTPDFLFYLDSASLLATLKEVAAKQGEHLIPAHLAKLEKWKAVAASANIEKGETIETIVTFGSWKIPPGHLKNTALHFAPVNTFLYFDTQWDASLHSSNALRQNLPPAIQQLFALENISLDDLGTAFGNEAGGFLWWNPTSMIPSMVLVADIQDGVAAKRIAHSLQESLESNILVTETAEMTTMSYKNKVAMGMIAPTLAIRNHEIFFALSPSDLQRAFDAKESSYNFEDSAVLKNAMPFFQPADLRVGILDLPILIQQLHRTLQPMLGFAELMIPGMNQVVDLKLLPKPEDLNKYLCPIIYRNHPIPDGLLMETRGPITLSSVLLGLAAGLPNGFENLETLAK